MLPAAGGRQHAGRRGEARRRVRGQARQAGERNGGWRVRRARLGRQGGEWGGGVGEGRHAGRAGTGCGSKQLRRHTSLVLLPSIPQEERQAAAHPTV